MLVEKLRMHPAMSKPSHVRVQVANLTRTLEVAFEVFTRGNSDFKMSNGHPSSLPSGQSMGDGYNVFDLVED